MKTKNPLDQCWNVVLARAADGSVLRYEYGSQDRPVCAVDHGGFKTFFEFDPNGNLTRIAEPSGSETLIEYDALDRRTKVNT